MHTMTERELIQRTKNDTPPGQSPEDQVAVPPTSYDDPLTLYKGENATLETRVVHSRKQHARAILDGFGPYNRAACEYPKSFYSAKGEHVKAWDPTEEEFLRDKGWQDRPFKTLGVQDRPTMAPPPPEPEDVRQETANSEVNERMDAIESRIDAQDAKLDAILNALNGQKPPKRGK